MIKSVNIAVFY